MPASEKQRMGKLKTPAQTGKQLPPPEKNPHVPDETSCLAEPAETPAQLHFLPPEFLTTEICIDEIRMTSFVDRKRPRVFQKFTGLVTHGIAFNWLDRSFRPDNDGGFTAPDRVVRSQQVFAGGVDHLAARVDGENVDIVI